MNMNAPRKANEMPRRAPSTPLRDFCIYTDAERSHISRPAQSLRHETTRSRGVRAACGLFGTCLPLLPDDRTSLRRLLTCAKAEPRPCPLHGHVGEAGRLQPPSERAGIDRRVSVTDVNQPKQKGSHAIEAREDPTRTQHPPRLG